MFGEKERLKVGTVVIDVVDGPNLTVHYHLTVRSEWLVVQTETWWARVLEPLVDRLKCSHG